MAELYGEVAKGRKKDYKKEDIMVKKKSEEKRKIEMKTNKQILEDKRFIKKYGLSKNELEELIIENQKFSTSFKLISNYLQDAKISIDQCHVKNCKQYIEIAKYIFKGCSE